MIIRHTILLLFCLISVPSGAQYQIKPDSLHSELQQAKTDSARYLLYSRLYSFYEESQRDSAFYYAQQSLRIAQQNDQHTATAIALNRKAYQLMNAGKYAASYQCILESYALLDSYPDEKNIWMLAPMASSEQDHAISRSFAHHMMGILMYRTNNRPEAINFYRLGKQFAQAAGSPFRIIIADMNIGLMHYLDGQLDSALVYEQRAEDLASTSGIKRYVAFVKSAIGDIYLQQGDTARALQYYYDGVDKALEANNSSSLIRNYFRLNKYYLDVGQADSALRYAILEMDVFRTLNPVVGIEFNLGIAYEQLYKSYLLKDNIDSILHYAGLALITKDSIAQDRIANLAEFQNLSFGEQNRLRDEAKEKERHQNKIQTYALLSGLMLFSVIALLLYRNNRQKHKAKTEIEKAFHDLKATQQQLIHTEKMASLGELTAGIAHEIQNPLNFVNNFSEVNTELIEELNAELATGNLQLAKEIGNNIKENEEKIIFHGKRADAIVKGMLQHSRASSGQKEPTDINALTDEYLRLAYHGLRAKDKSFNASINTNFDTGIGLINIVPQEIGRVILNLITNAFYVVSEKRKASQNGYDPSVTVSTKKIADKIQLSVRDNGNGIPPDVLDKIFQPFFTTKPTGQGTGLGLSLSYDIIKAHGGELKVETKEGKGSEFIIQLPVNGQS